MNWSEVIQNLVSMVVGGCLVSAGMLLERWDKR